MFIIILFQFVRLLLTLPEGFECDRFKRRWQHSLDVRTRTLFPNSVHSVAIIQVFPHNADEMKSSF